MNIVNIATLGLHNPFLNKFTSTYKNIFFYEPSPYLPEEINSDIIFLHISRRNQLKLIRLNNPNSFIVVAYPEKPPPSYMILDPSIQKNCNLLIGSNFDPLILQAYPAFKDLVKC